MAIRICATYKVTTPMFCGGANPKDAEFRLPSFKGVLRYWWRALAWSECDGNLSDIRKFEDRLFGSTGTGQSRISMRLTSPPSASECRADEVLQVPGMNRVVGDGARYLGYGVMEAFASGKRGTKAGQLTRSCLGAGFNFTVQMRVSAGSQQHEMDQKLLVLLEKALIAVGIFGGVGAKSRKGYGSVSISSLCVDGKQRPVPRSRKDLCERIAALRRQYGSSRFPEYTALSRDARYLLLTGKTKKPLELLDLVGRELMRFRSWGHNGKLFGRPSEKNFEDDHDLMKDVSNRQKPRNHPRRVAFGLPHNYGKQQVGPYGDLDRRASPLFIHIHHCEEGPVAVLSFLPARFLPSVGHERPRISVGRYHVQQAPEDELYRPLNEFLDRLLNMGEGSAGKRKEPFTYVEEVLP